MSENNLMCKEEAQLSLCQNSISSDDSIPCGQPLDSRLSRFKTNSKLKKRRTAHKNKLKVSPNYQLYLNF